MKLQIAILVFALIIISMGDVYGADWSLYASDKDGSYYLDAQSITRPSKNIVRVWEKWNFTEKGVMHLLEKFGEKYQNLSHTIFLNEVDCIEKKLRNLSLTYYDKEGKVMWVHEKSSEWQFLIPESRGEYLYEIICK